MQNRRVCNANSPCLLTKYAIFALRYVASGMLAGCNRHDCMGFVRVMDAAWQGGVVANFQRRNHSFSVFFRVC